MWFGEHCRPVSSVVPGPERSSGFLSFSRSHGGDGERGGGGIHVEHGVDAFPVEPLPGDGDGVVRLVEMLALEQTPYVPAAAGDVESPERLLGASHRGAISGLGIGAGEVGDDAELQLWPRATAGPAPKLPATLPPAMAPRDALRAWRLVRAMVVSSGVVVARTQNRRGGWPTGDKSEPKSRAGRGLLKKFSAPACRLVKAAFVRTVRAGPFLLRSLLRSTETRGRKHSMRLPRRTALGLLATIPAAAQTAPGPAAPLRCIVPSARRRLRGLCPHPRAALSELLGSRWWWTTSPAPTA